VRDSSVVALTSQLVGARVESNECSQLRKLGWDATYETRKKSVNAETSCPTAIERPSVVPTRQLVIVHPKTCQSSEVSKLCRNTTCLQRACMMASALIYHVESSALKSHSPVSALQLKLSLARETRWPSSVGMRPVKQVFKPVRLPCCKCHKPGLSHVYHSADCCRRRAL